jgi:zona occludens toxin (predicted ATPase)
VAVSWDWFDTPESLAAERREDEHKEALAKIQAGINWSAMRAKQQAANEARIARDAIYRNTRRAGMLAALGIGAAQVSAGSRE